MFYTTDNVMTSSIDNSNITSAIMNSSTTSKAQSNIRFYIEKISVSVYDDYKFNLSSDNVDVDLKYNKLCFNIEDIIISLNLTELFKSNLSIHSFYVKEQSICNNNNEEFVRNNELDSGVNSDIPWIYTIVKYDDYTEQTGRGHIIDTIETNSTNATNKNEEKIYCCDSRPILTCYHQSNVKRIITPPQIEGISICILYNYLAII